MAQMGHTHPGLALRIYASAMRLDEGERERLRALVEGADWAAMGSERDSDAPDKPPSEVRVKKNPRASGGSAEADDGTRTHDLLHGKQTL